MENGWNQQSKQLDLKATENKKDSQQILTKFINFNSNKN